MHIHVYSPDGEAKFWIEPQIELAVAKGHKETELKEVKERKEDEIREHWNQNFGGGSQ